MKYFIPLLFVVFLIGCVKTPKTPPPEWSILTNGFVFRWERPNGQMSIMFEYKTKEEAIEGAWKYYHWVKEREQIEMNSKGPWKKIQ